MVVSRNSKVFIDCDHNVAPRPNTSAVGPSHATSPSVVFSTVCPHKDLDSSRSLCHSPSVPPTLSPG